MNSGYARSYERPFWPSVTIVRISGEIDTHAPSLEGRVRIYIPMPLSTKYTRLCGSTRPRDREIQTPDTPETPAHSLSLSIPLTI
jgi:hypothetical protein